MDEVAEVSEALMERYLEGEEISHEEIVTALKDGTNHGDIFPVVCGVATKNLGTNRLLDAIVEDLPSTVKHGALELPEVTLEPDADKELFAYVFKTRADAVRRARQLLPRLPGLDEARLAGAEHARARQGAHRPAADLRGQGLQARRRVRPGRHRRRRQAQGDASPATGWPRATSRSTCRPSSCPRPVMAFAIQAHAKGDEDKMFQSLRRLQEEDPTIDLHRDQQTGEQIVAGLSQMHVEVVVDRLKSRFGVEVDLKPPRVPYQETIRKPAKAHGRHKKQTGGRGQFGDCHIEIEPLGERPGNPSSSSSTRSRAA